MKKISKSNWLDMIKLFLICMAIGLVVDAVFSMILDRELKVKWVINFVISLLACFIYYLRSDEVA